jgi:hypothetical protein
MKTKATGRDRTRILKQVKMLAKEYRDVFGRPLGVTGEVAEYEACRHMNLRSMPPRHAGYDAETREGRKIQIKGRVRLPDTSPSQRVGSIRFNHEWDEVWLVILDEDFDAIGIYRATRAALARAVNKPGSKARTDRGQLNVTTFKSIGEKIWPQT